MAYDPTVHESCGRDLYPEDARAAELHIVDGVASRVQSGPFLDMGESAVAAYEERDLSPTEEAYMHVMPDESSPLQRLLVGRQLIIDMNIPILGKRPHDSQYDDRRRRFFEASGYEGVYRTVHSDEWVTTEAAERDGYIARVYSHLDGLWRRFWNVYGGTSDDRIMIRQNVIVEIDDAIRQLGRDDSAATDVVA